MPITQDRMLDLIDVSTNLIENYRKLKAQADELLGTKDSEIQRLLSDLRASGIDPNHPAIIRLLDLKDGIIYRIHASAPSIDDISIIAREQAHFNVRKNLNQQSRQYARKFREKQKAKRAQEMPVTDLNLDFKPSEKQILETIYISLESLEKPEKDVHDIIDILKNKFNIQSEVEASRIINKFIENNFATLETEGRNAGLIHLRARENSQ